MTAKSEHRAVIRDFPAKGTRVETFQRFDAFIASSAAIMATIPGDRESAAHWYNIACRHGISFG